MLKLFKQQTEDLNQMLDVVSENIMSVSHVSKRYMQEDESITVVSDVSFTIKRGEFLSIVGRSGSGKTTILNLLGTMVKPTFGSIYFNGVNFADLKESQLTQIRRENIATIYQNYNLIPVLTAIQNVEIPLLLTTSVKSEVNQRAHELLKLMGLEDRANHRPHQLSGGERKRVTIARALANNPELILADEPTSDLDKEIGADIINILLDINKKGTTLVMVTHDLELAKLADRTIYVKNGTITKIVDHIE